MRGIDLTAKDPKTALVEDLNRVAERHNVLMFGFACLRATGSRDLLVAAPESAEMTLDGFAGSMFTDFTKEQRTALADALKAVLRAQLVTRGTI